MRKRKPMVLCDADGVLLDFHTAAMRAFEPLLGRTYRLDEYRGWDIFSTIDPNLVPACRAALHAHGFCANIEPFPGALEAVQQLRELAEVHVVTTPQHSRYWYYERTEAMVRRFGFQPHEVHHVSAKQITGGDLLLDDSPTHVEGWIRRNIFSPWAVPMLWDQPNNRFATQLDRFRVDNWETVFRAVRELADVDTRPFVDIALAGRPDLHHFATTTLGEGKE